MPDKLKQHQSQGLLKLSLIWLVGTIVDCIWLTLDHSIPAWDQAEYLTGSLNYWQALQQPQWLNSEWWTNFWQLSTKAPPLTFITSAIVQNIFGTGLDQAILVNLLFSAILLTAVYGLGVQLFSIEVGLWAAGLCQLFPAFYQIRLDFLLDYPLVAVVTLSFWCLTAWRQGNRHNTSRRNTSWQWAIAFGISFGLALLVKQTALFFLLTPLLWVGAELLFRRKWQRLLQLFVGLLLSVVVFAPWYRINWLLILTGGKRATVDSALAEGDPALNTLAAWTYYWKVLPDQVSWLLLLVPIVGLILYWIRSVLRSGKKIQHLYKHEISHLAPFIWLAVFLVGAYLLCSLNINKDNRYVLPYLPVVSLLLAYGLTHWYGRWGNRIRWGTVALAILLALLNLFPVGGALNHNITQVLSPNAQHYTYLGKKWQHEQVIDAIVKMAPHVKSTLGVLPSTPEVNQHNLNYYGALEDFQVYGRQVGTVKQQIEQDARSLDWFVTKTGNQGSIPEAQAAIVQRIQQGSDFRLHKTWNLPDKSTLKLYHRLPLSIEVKPIAADKKQKTGDTIKLSRVTLPPQVPPGVPVPVTYEWLGNWEQLQHGLVLLTWQNQNLASPHDWLHDHAIGMGTLYSSSPDASSRTSYSVIERMAMLPPAVPSGIYTLKATYLNRRTGEADEIAIPPVTLTITPNAPAIPAPELDLLTQERILAATLPQGRAALDRIFAEVGRINQYDPVQDYLVQIQQSMTYRLQQEPQNREYAYALALSYVLQQKVPEAIAALEHVTRIDSQNPYAYAYLAFVHLYNWDGAAAQAALKPALALQPNLLELQALNGIAALMQGQLLKAWHELSLVIPKTDSN